jgi:hypothetical protein
MQLLYCSTIGLQSVRAGSSDLEKSMQSSRADFSSLHTQHGYECIPVSRCSASCSLTLFEHKVGRTFGLLADSAVFGALFTSAAGAAAVPEDKDMLVIKPP